MKVGRPPLHGMSGTSIYQTWLDMVRRCENPNYPAFANYGARGITICERWRSFQAFYADMGDRPVGMEIERIDNDGPYSPENCKWATCREQSRNRRSSILLTFEGVTLCALDWARRKGWCHGVVYRRIAAGWTVERILTQPPRARRRAA